jgi:hypothetical protein
LTVTMMHQRRNRKLFIVGIIALMCLSLLSPAYTKAAPLFELAQDTISDSDLGATNVTHTFLASTTQAIPIGGYFEIVFHTDFSNVLVGGVACPSSGTSTVTGNTVRCGYASGLASGPYTITVSGVTNPAIAGSYVMNLYTKTSADAVIERSSVAVAILDDVTVTASVNPYLIFSVSGLATSSEVNGVLTTGSSTSELMEFGVLNAAASSTLGQGLQVTTNAPYGFVVTVFQDHNLLSGNGADIDSFLNGNPASTTAYAWVQPTADITNEATWGHFGLTSDDDSLLGGDEFGDSLYKGLEGTDPLTVMYANGPADGATDSIGSTTVAYTIGISEVQEMGDYSNTLTYICTPTF